MLLKEMRGFFLSWTNEGIRGVKVEGLIFRGVGYGRGEYQQRKILIIYQAHEWHKAKIPLIAGRHSSANQ
jgi:hypothetical protein